MEEQRARQERDAREAVTASVAESTALSTGINMSSFVIVFYIEYLDESAAVSTRINISFVTNK